MLPSYLMYLLMDNFGFPGPAYALNLVGWVIFIFMSKDFKLLNSAPPEAWKLDISTFRKTI